MAKSLTIKNLQLRNSLKATWETKNPVLLAGELGIEKDTGKFKIGDGTKAWNELGYANESVDLSNCAKLNQENTFTTLNEFESEVHFGGNIKVAEHGVIEFEDHNGAVQLSSEGFTGNAATATNLQNPAKINGVDFDGSQDITIDVGVKGPDAAIDSQVAVFDGTTGKLIKDSGFTIATSVPADAKFTDTTYTKADFGVDTLETQVAAIQETVDTLDTDYLAANATVTVSGDATGSAAFAANAANVAVTLANSGVEAGTYAKVTVDAKGRVTTGAALEASDIPALTLEKITDAGTAASKNVGTAEGNVPVLDANGKLAESVLPSIAITDTYVVENEEAMLALTVQVGDIAVRTDVSKTFILKSADATNADNWVELKSPDCKIVSVNGKTGAVTLTTSDIAEGDNLYFTEERATANFNTNIATTNASALADGAHIVLDTDEIIIDCGGAE